MSKVVFLDRDGTVNVDYGYVHEAENFELLPDVIAGLKMLQDMGFSLLIITNQSGIARGYFSEEEYIDFQNYVKDYLKSEGINILDFYYCPHGNDDMCNCRKPKTGLFYRACKDYEIEWESSYVIGDKLRDLAICKEKPVKGFLITDKNSNEICDVRNIVCVESLYDAANKIKEEVN